MENFYTLYLDSMIDDATLEAIEQAIGRECAHVDYKTPAINVYTSDPKIIDDARYWLNVGGIKITEVAPD